MTLTKIQKQERAKRKRNMLKMRGLPTPPGTRPRKYTPVAEPGFKPIPTYKVPYFGHLLSYLNLMFTPWWRRRQK